MRALGSAYVLGFFLVACGSSGGGKAKPSDGGTGGEAAGNSGGKGGGAGKGGTPGKGGNAGSAGGGRGGGTSGGEGGRDTGTGGDGGTGGSNMGSGGDSGGSGASGGEAGTPSGGSGANGGEAGTPSDGTAGEAGEASGGTGATSGGNGGAGEASGGVGGAEPECSPSNDTCAAGSYCTPEGVCAPGCGDAEDCASGRCLESHACERCLSDTECPVGTVCGSGTCRAPCTELEGCGDAALTCCDGRCVDVTRDVSHCGACGGAGSPNTCGGAQFCGTSGCNEATIANVCDNALVTAVQDGIGPDDQAALALAQTLAAGCDPAPATRTVGEVTTDVLNPNTGRPVVGGGEVLVIGGGPFGQNVMAYLESQRIAPVYSEAVGSDFRLVRSSDGLVLGSIPSASSTASHDLLLIEVVRDPASGTFLLVAYGFNGTGTNAAVWYLANVMVPGPLSTYDQRYYVIEWTDDGDLAPDAGDTFTLITSG